MQSTHILRKFSCPLLPPTVLYRPMLVAKLRDAMGSFADEESSLTFHYQMLLLCAPGGYGKTTVLVQLAQQLPIACCWYILDSADADAMVFLRSLVLSLRQKFPQFGISLDDMFHQVQSAREDSRSLVQADYEHLLHSIIEAMESDIPERFILILCNYHEINTNPLINRLVDQLLEQLPERNILIIESRAIPALNLASHLAHRKMMGLGNNDIRFSSEEICELAYLQGAAPLSDEEATYLATTFDGWIAGILLGTRLGTMQLLQTTVQQQKDATIAINKQNLFAYLMREVFARETEVFSFLKDAAILQQMTPHVCQQLLERDDALVRLTYLEQQGLFVSRSGEHPEAVFTCHPVLRNLLREELQRTNGERFIQLHAKAAQLFQMTQEYDQAIYHAHQSHNDEFAAQLICEAYWPLLYQDQPAIVDYWLHQISASVICQYPHLLLVQAMLRLDAGKQEQVHALLEGAEHLLSQPSPHCKEKEIPILRAQIALVRCRMLFLSGQYAQAQDLCRRTLARLPENEIHLRAEAHLRLGMCADALGNVHEGIQELQRALHLSRWQPQSRQTARLHTQLANVYHLTGNYALSEYHRTRAVQCWEMLHDEQGKINNLISMGVVLQRHGTFAGAEAILKQALESAQRMQNAQQGEAYALISLGDLYQDQGRYQEAVMVIEDGLSLARLLGHRYLIVYSLCALAVTYLMMNDPATAQVHLAEIETYEEQSPLHLKEKAIYDCTRGTIQLYLHNYSEATTLLRGVAQTFMGIGFKREQIQCLLRLAASYCMQQQESLMLQCLQLVLEATAHHEYEQLFQIELQRMPYLLQAINRYPETAPLKALLMQSTVLLNEDISNASPLSLPPTPPVLVTAIGKPLPRLQIYGFGQPTILLDDKPVTHWRMARAMELCFFLLEKNKPIHKEKIIAALCSDEDVRADQTFRSAVHYLRKALGEQSIVARAGCYSIDLQSTYGQNVEYDVSLFQTLAQQAKQGKKNTDIVYQALTQMVELYRGDYLQSFYSDWCIFQRDNLRREYMDARHQLALIAWQCEQFDESIDHWQHLLALDNCIEEAYQGLMLCYLRQKKRGAALRQYQQCVATLREEMGITPGPELQNLYHQLTGYSSEPKL